ncbi:MAG: hypothetical protein OEW26_00815 [Nitrospirota bacterium]|nr:hypothetical protein [Nitrospirota bacterium]
MSWPHAGIEFDADPFLPGQFHQELEPVGGKTSSLSMSLFAVIKINFQGCSQGWVVMILSAPLFRHQPLASVVQSSVASRL